MSKKKMLEARDLIKQKRYQEARAILETIDHPKADEWLQQLDRIPAAKKSGRGSGKPASIPSTKRASASSSAGSRLLRVVLLLVVVGVVIMGAVVLAPRFLNRTGGGTAAAANNTPYANYMPADTAFYATLRTDDAYITELDGILQKVVAKLPANTLPAGTPTSLPAVFDQAVKMLDPTGDFKTTIRSWLGDRAAVGATIDAEGLSDFVAVIGSTNKANAVAFIDKYSPILMMGQPFTKTEEGSFTLYTAPNDVAFIAVGSDIIALSNKKALLPLTGAPAANLSMNPTFNNTVSTLTAGAYNFVVYADLPILLDSTAGETMRQMEQDTAILKSVGTLAIGGTMLDGRSLVLDVVNKRGDLTAATEQGFVLPSTGTLDPAFLANIPANASLVAQGTNLKALYEVMLANLRNAAKQGTVGEGLDEAQLDEALVPFNQTIEGITGGLKLEDDILSWMTGDYAAYVVYNVPEVGVPFIPMGDQSDAALALDFGVVVKATDPAKAQNLVDKIGTTLETMGASSGATVTREQINGINAVIVQMPLVGAAPTEVVLAANQNVLVIGTRASVTTVLNGGGFNTAAKYTEAKTYLLPNATSFWFADTGATTLIADVFSTSFLAASAVMTDSGGVTTTTDLFDSVKEIQTQLRQVAGLVSSASMTSASNTGGDSLLRVVLTLAP